MNAKYSLKLSSIYIFSFIISIFLFSCSGSKMMYKKGLKLEEAGMYNEASNFYYDALKRDITNVDASIRLNNLGQVILSDYLDDFVESANKGYKKNTINSFLKAKHFKKKLSEVNINLTIPDGDVFKYEKIKSEYVNEELNRINELLDKEKFVEAQKAIKEVLKIDPNNQEIRDLDGYSTAEPIYRRAMSLYEQGEYKKSFYEFDKVLNYKDAREVKALAKEKATLVIVVRQIENDSEYYDLDERLTLKLEELFSENKNPFIKIIGSEAYNRLLSEKKYSKNNEWQNHSSKVLDADVFLDVTINNVNIYNSKLKETRKRGWELYRKKIIDEETKEEKYINDFRKVFYYEYSKSKQVSIDINFKLKSFDTNEVLLNKYTSDKRTDKVVFIDYDGEIKNLRSGYWNSRSEKSQRDFINNSSYEIKSIRNKFYARRTLKPTNTLENETLTQIASSIIYNVDKYSSKLK